MINVKFTLCLTHDCNLTCNYCYSGRKFKKHMSLATAQKIIDFAFDTTPPSDKISIGFFGGEPLLKFDLIKNIVNYIHKKDQNTINPNSLYITTNGTLLNEDYLYYFKKEFINLCISIDGPAQIHNLNRLYRDGRESFTDVFKNLQLTLQYLTNFQVNAVYGPDTIDFLPETVSFFTQLNVPSIHLNPNIQALWNENDITKLRNFYMQIADKYIECYENGQEIALNLIDSKIIIFLKEGYEDTDKCGMGETEFGFAPSGNIYPCERFIGDDETTQFCLGNIHSGIERFNVCSLPRPENGNKNDCINCKLQKYCMNWCSCTNYFMTGNVNLPSTFLCESEKAIIKAARKVLINLKNNDLFLNHFLNYNHDLY